MNALSIAEDNYVYTLLSNYKENYQHGSLQ